MTYHAIRLGPGRDIKESILDYCVHRHIEAGFIATTVGSLSRLHIRLADATQSITRTESFEIVSLVGTVSKNGVHLHLSVSDQHGAVCGGHLKSGCIIYTTAEIIIKALNHYEFTRVHDEETGWRELHISPKPT